MATMPQPASPQMPTPQMPTPLTPQSASPLASSPPLPVPQPQPMDEEVPYVAPPKLGFFQQPLVQNVLPFATSLIFHLSIVSVGYVFVKELPKVVQAVREQIIIPDSNIVNDAPVGGVVNPGLNGDPNRAAAQDKVETQDASSFSDKKTESLSQSLMGGSPTDAADTAIALGKNSGVISGVGKATGPGTGDGGGQLAPFGVPGGGTAGPKAPFMGISGNAIKIVYLVDASGSMMTVFPHVKEELYKSVDHLTIPQEFNVIFFHDEPADLAAFTKGDLAMATPANKLAIHKFAADQSAHGGTRPDDAIRLAFSRQPDMIYVLTDGFDNVDSFQAVIDMFAKLNTNKHTRVNTIFLRSSDDPQLVKVLQTIAQQSGGKFITVDEKDF